jgi:hypothetical protein
LQIQEYDCKVEYRPGFRMVHVDGLSRNAIEINNEFECIFDVLGIDTDD